MKVIISAGGTGGHIYPALAIINKIKEKEPDSKFLYIGTHNRMEKDIVPKRGIPYESIEMYGFNKKHLLKNIKTINCLIKANKKCKKLIKEFDPDIVIGVGGYVTVPVIKEASKLGYKTFIHEQNSIPGKSNRYLSKYVNKIGLSFKSSEKYLPKEKTVLTGNPCSEDALKIDPVNKKELGLDENKKLVLIVMGSLGSNSVNQIIEKGLDKFKGKNYEVLFITGKPFYKNIKDLKYPKNVKIIPFYEGLTKILKKTDLLITRAGASTLSELIALDIPSILIPSPYVANNHQYINAKDITDQKAALMIEEKDLTMDKLVNTIDWIINDKDTTKKIKENLKQFQITNSAEKIYNELRKVIDE